MAQGASARRATGACLLRLHLTPLRARSPRPSSQLHMIANRDVIESEILRGRQKVRSQIGRARRLTNPEAPHTPTPPPTAAASPSRAESDAPPPLAHRPSIPIDSDAETKYNDEWERFKAREGGSGSGSRARGDAAVGLGRSGSNSPVPGSSAGKRRSNGKGKGKAAYLDRHPEDDETTDQPSSDAEGGGPRPSPFSTIQSSFRRIRTQSFPAIHLPWPGAAPRSRGTSPASSRAASSALQARNAPSGGARSRSRKIASTATSPRGTEPSDATSSSGGLSAYSSSDEDDEDELRILSGGDYDDDFPSTFTSAASSARRVDGLPPSLREADDRSWGSRDDEEQVDSLVA